MMERRIFIASALAFLAAPLVADAQQMGKVARIGVLLPQSASLSGSNIAALREGLHQLGYIEGQSIIIEYRFADGDFDRLAGLVAELIKAQAWILIVGGTTPARVAKESTSTILIVFAGVSDPVEVGLAASFAHPGGNATGLSTAHEDGFAGKWVEVLREVAPKAKRVLVIHNPSNPTNIRYWREIQGAAQWITLRSLEVRTIETLDQVLMAISRQSADGLIVVTDPLLSAHRIRIVQAANREKIPAVFGFREFVESGGLVSYGASLAAMYRTAAAYVDKILKGAKPGDIPVEQPPKFELVINLKTAKALGITVPPSLLQRADQVIE